MAAVCRLRLLAFGIAERTQLAEPGTSQSELGWLRGFYDHYQIGQQLGRGSFGTVSLATEVATGQECAVKVIPKQRSAGSRTGHTQCLQSSSKQAAAHCLLIDVPLAIHNKVFCVVDGPCDRGQKKPCICPSPKSSTAKPPPRRRHGFQGATAVCADKCRAQSWDLMHDHLMRKQQALQVSHLICCCLCRQGATVEHILSKIQQEVEILRRMQGRPEALRLHAVFEVRRGCFQKLAISVGCTQWGALLLSGAAPAR